MVQEKAEVVTSWPPLTTEPSLDSTSCETSAREPLEYLFSRVENVAAACCIPLFCTSLPEITTLIVQAVEEDMGLPVSPLPNSFVQTAAEGGFYAEILDSDLGQPRN